MSFVIRQGSVKGRGLYLWSQYRKRDPNSAMGWPSSDPGDWRADQRGAQVYGSFREAYRVAADLGGRVVRLVRRTPRAITTKKGA